MTPIPISDFASLPTGQGVYLINCIANGKFYVGSSINVRNRLKQHYAGVTQGKAVNRHLQHAWDKYGAEAFFVEILESVENRTNLFDREQYWIDRLNAVKQGFNISATACRPANKADLVTKEAVHESIEIRLPLLTVIKLTLQAKTCGVTVEQLASSMVCDAVMGDRRKLPTSCHCERGNY